MWSRNYEDYDLLVYSANWPDKRMEAWKTLLKARAIENQSYVIGVNCFGVDAWKNSYSGSSMLVGFDGRLIREIPEGEQIVNAELERDKLNKFRSDFPFLKDRDPVRFI